MKKSVLYAPLLGVYEVSEKHEEEECSREGWLYPPSARGVKTIYGDPWNMTVFREMEWRRQPPNCWSKGVVASYCSREAESLGIESWSALWNRSPSPLEGFWGDSMHLADCRFNTLMTWEQFFMQQRPDLACGEIDPTQLAWDEVNRIEEEVENLRVRFAVECSPASPRFVGKFYLLETGRHEQEVQLLELVGDELRTYGMKEFIVVMAPVPHFYEQLVRAGTGKELPEEQVDRMARETEARLRGDVYGWVMWKPGDDAASQMWGYLGKEGKKLAFEQGKQALNKRNKENSHEQ